MITPITIKTIKIATIAIQALFFFFFFFLDLFLEFKASACGSLAVVALVDLGVIFEELVFDEAVTVEEFEDIFEALIVVVKAFEDTSCSGC